MVGQLFLPLTSALPSHLVIMRGKRARTASSSPQYERVVWTEQKTSRGSRIVPKAQNSPKTPKFKKWVTPKKRRLDVSPVASMDLDTGGDNNPGSLVPIQLKKRSGKVRPTTPQPKHH